MGRLQDWEGFGGGILAHKQSKEVGKFYDLQPRRDTPMDVFAHNTTTIRNLAEIRHRENVPPVETQYQPPAPMLDLLPDPASSPDMRKAIADIRDLKKPKAMAPTNLINGDLKGKAPEEPILAPGKHTSLTPFAISSAEDQPGPSSSQGPLCPPSDEGTGLQPAPSPAPIIELEPEVIKPDREPAREPATSHPQKLANLGAAEQHITSQQPQGRADQPGAKPSAVPAKMNGHEGDKKRTKLGGIFRRNKTSSDESSAAASAGVKLNTKATAAAQDLERFRGSIPEIRIGEGPVTKEEKEEIVERYQALLEAGVRDPLTMMNAAGGAIQPIIELPPARTHSVSEDTYPALKTVRERQHSLSTDALVPSGMTTASHTLAHDKAIGVKSSVRRAHRLSADATIPVQIAAPGHYLDADPTVNTPQQLFSHELLDDMVVHRQNKSPQPHGLDSDKKFSLAHKDRQPHSLRSDKQILTVQKQPQSHPLHTDKVLPGMAKSKQHELPSDHVVTPKASAARAVHNIAHDVRILSPSGQVRNPHSMSADEVVRQTAVFRKSPHPEAMPGHYNQSSSSADTGENAMASLNASLQNAGQALGELNRALEGRENDAARKSPSGQGFWGRVFGRKEGQVEGPTTGEEGVRESPATQGVQWMETLEARH